MTPRIMAVAIPARLESKMRLSASSHFDHGTDKYIFFLVTRNKEFDRVSLEDLFMCLEILRDILVGTSQTSVSLPIIDSGRGNIKLRDVYSLLATIFFSNDITVYLHDRYYLSII